MKQLPYLICIVTLLCLTACSSVDKRISKNQALFDNYSVGEQGMIRTGQVAVGFDPDQVRMALGAPDEEITVQTAVGKEIVWEYREAKPSFGFSLGGSTGSRGSGVGTGVGVGMSPNRYKILQRIYFDRDTGNVSRIESF